jgi:hypothetical protein
MYGGLAEGKFLLSQEVENMEQMLINLEEQEIPLEGAAGSS